jgi:hypothetical protein
VGDVKHCRGVKEKLNLLYRIAADNSRLEGMLFVENMPVWYSFRSVLLDAIFLSHCFSFLFVSGKVQHADFHTKLWWPIANQQAPPLYCRVQIVACDTSAGRKHNPHARYSKIILMGWIPLA